MNIKWTKGEKVYIRENADAMKDRELAEKLTEMSGRSVTLDAVRKVRQKMGISKKPGRGICAVVRPHVENSKGGLSDRENEGGSFQAVSDPEA